MAGENKELKECRSCPFCDEEIAEAAFPYCEACGVKLLRCPACQMPIPRDSEKCPHCGVNIKEAASRGG
jgi:hypothetical protein